MTQSIDIDLGTKNKVYLIEKHKEQGKVYQLELTFSGKLSDNITVYLSNDGVSGTQSIRIKNGKVNTSFASRWDKNQAYLLIENPYNSTSKLALEYQFVTE
ncbi:MAG: hypothetical protein M9916_12555 [Crocinitomicaceae bacterium]|nr:hypothetical protein [Crocinitomicaceae bacterium]